MPRLPSSCKCGLCDIWADDDIDWWSSVFGCEMSQQLLNAVDFPAEKPWGPDLVQKRPLSIRAELVDEATFNYLELNELRRCLVVTRDKRSAERRMQLKLIND